MECLGFFFLIKKSEIWWWWPLSIISVHFHSHADEVYFYFSACAYCSSPAAPQRLPLFEPWWSFFTSHYENSCIRCSCDWNPLLHTLVLRLNEKYRFLKFNVTEIWCHLLIWCFAYSILWLTHSVKGWHSSNLMLGVFLLFWNQILPIIEQYTIFNKQSWDTEFFSLWGFVVCFAKGIRFH